MQRIRDAFDRQAFMRTLGAQLTAVEDGSVTIACVTDERWTQQHGSKERLLARMTATRVAVSATSDN